MVDIDSVIYSYKKEFKAPIGAYAYMLLNQHFPELFVVSSLTEKNYDLSAVLEKIFRDATSMDEINAGFNGIDKDLFGVINANVESDISWDNAMKVVSNLKYLNVSWDESSWSNLSGVIEYNGFGNFISKKDDLINELSTAADEFSMKGISVNPNFKVYDFLSNLRSGINTMCKVLNFDPKKIGLNELHLNYQTEEGDFTGYMDLEANKMVIKKTEVFAHEWMHFIDSSLGVKGHALTGLMDISSAFSFAKLMPYFSELDEFKNTVATKNVERSAVEFPEALVSVSHFLSKYAISKNSFFDDVAAIGKKFEGDAVEDAVGAKSSLTASLKACVSDACPPRYFAFIDAQCESYIGKITGKELITNQLIDFAKTADQVLGEQNYTESTIEVFARTFESYVHSKIVEEGGDCSVVADSYDSDMYPQSKMKESMDARWDKMWLQLSSVIDTLSVVNVVENKMCRFSMSNISVLRARSNINKVTNLSGDRKNNM